MWTTAALLTGGTTSLLTLYALPTRWALEPPFAAAAYAAAFATVLGWIRLLELQRDILSTFAWPDEIAAYVHGDPELER